MFTDMYVESTLEDKQVKVAKRTIVDVMVDDQFYPDKGRFIGQTAYPHSLCKWEDGTYGFSCDINGDNFYFHSVKLNKGFR